MTVEIGAHQVQGGAVVVDHDDDRIPVVVGPGRTDTLALPRGTVKPNVLPTPTSVCSVIAPPISATIRRHKVRPRPVPSSRDALRPCWKDSKIRSRSSRRDANSVVSHRNGQPVSVRRRAPRPGRRRG